MTDHDTTDHTDDPSTEGGCAPADGGVRRVLLAAHTGRADIVSLARTAAARLQSGGIVVRLLEADPPTLALLHRDPFDGARPRWVRAVSYRYRFSTRAEKRASADAAPRAVSSRRPYPDLLTSAGFVEIGARDVTDEYRATTLAWLSESESVRDRLCSVIGLVE